MSRESRPFERVALSTTNRPAEFFVRQVQKRGMDINPAYQRGEAWTADQQRALILSWLMGVPIPAVVINDRHNSTWLRNNPQDRAARGYAYAIIDGKQRILTAVAWFTGDLYVPAGWFPDDEIAEAVEMPEGRMVNFDRLTESGQTFFENVATFPCAEAQLGSLADEARVYLLVNGGGTPQTDADMDNARRVAGQ